jgi:tRNA (cmo5U34)-methyltransferase
MDNPHYDPQLLAASFGASAAVYDAFRSRLIPCYQQFYGSAVELLPFPASAEPRILDLGAGTGLMSAWVLERYPNARLTLLDLSPEMLEQARQRLAGARHAPEFRKGDYSEASLGGPFEAVVSALSIHHLDDARKQRLFAAIHRALLPGGVFVNAEQVAGPTESMERFYVERWLSAARAAGLEEKEVDAAKQRMALDKHVTAELQMGWLKDAGFEEVDLWFKYGRMAVYSGRKPR